MTTFVCWQTLMATILVWVCVFGVVDTAVHCIEKKIHQVYAYICLLVTVVVFLISSREVTICSLM